MHPEDIESLGKATPGERTVFRFLREAARPDADFIGWYILPSGNRAGSRNRSFWEPERTSDPGSQRVLELVNWYFIARMHPESKSVSKTLLP